MPSKQTAAVVGMDTDSFEDWLKRERSLAKRLALGEDFRIRKQADIRLEDLDASLRLWKEYRMLSKSDVSDQDPLRRDV